MKKIIIAFILTLANINVIAQDTIHRTASYYGTAWNGRRTANGDIYNSNVPSAASNDYPLGTRLLVINKTTGQSTIVIVNDRMAKWVKDRIDLSNYSFKRIAPLAQGIQKVKIIKLKAL